MNFNKQKTERKRNALSSPKVRQSSHLTLFFYKYALVVIIALIVTAAGLSIGFIRGILNNTPNISLDSIHSKGFITMIYDKDGNVTRKLSTSDSNRVYVSLDEIPANLQNAFISIEDVRFYNHNGIDMRGIARSLLLGLKEQNLDQGGSTITQQLIKNNVLGIQPEKTTIERIERKIKEQSLALELEKITSKQKILEEYLNAINLGEGTLGVQTASQKYFHKDVSDLTLSECTVLAGITKNPTKMNPITHPNNNAARRMTILKTMLEEHYITKSEYSEAVNDNVYERIQKINARQQKSSTANSYFDDALILQVVHDLKEKLGYDETKAYNAIYSGGLKIYSTQDSKIQKIADKVTNDPKNYPEGTKVALSYSLSGTDKHGREVSYSENDVLSYMKKNKLGNSLIFKNKSAAEESARKFTKSLKKHGVTVINEQVSTVIQPQISMTIMNQNTGQVEALVGGRGVKSENLSLNRATGTTRQPGSTFKVLSTFLPALDAKKMTLATVYDDAPYDYLDTGRPVRNYYKGYRGFSTIRQAVTDSMNIVAAKTMADVTPEVSYEYLQKLGFTTLVDNKTTSDGKTYSDLNQSMALGGLTYGVTNLELTGAFSAVANGGNYYKPSLYTKVVDQSGKVLLKSSSSGTPVMRDSTAFLLTDAMKDVIKKGTGKPATLSSGMPAAGKTGTTTSNYDYWFTGYTPYHTASVWMGYDRNTSFSSGQQHEKIWKLVMDQIIAEKGESKKDFSMPKNIVKARICTKSGKLAVKGVCDHDPRGSTVKTEYFALGTKPNKPCDVHVAVDICKESGYPANSACPPDQLYRRIYITRPKGSRGTTDDSKYQIPDLYVKYMCGLHTPE
ncbi:transglycosylase domain-containing protein [Anaerostipes sp.]|uniref:transglycosylase domain-containing protein n=1 Tax=Anaerostipes sp. TaxID=1872530 RepID=UPI0025C2C5D1|nr:transglycosylase domain-containing protein [Anaerostipes sp.]MBS7008547.1 transglycosylase domain-containing protein [Anaerostipes sp.]